MPPLRLALGTAHSRSPRADAPSKEWPTSGHDPGGMRSRRGPDHPACQRARGAWVHMKPPGAASDAAGPRAGADAPPPATVDRSGPPSASAAAPRRGAGAAAAAAAGRAYPQQRHAAASNGYEVHRHPLIQVVAVDSSRVRRWTFQLRRATPRSVARTGRRRAEPAQIVFGSSDGKRIP